MLQTADFGSIEGRENLRAAFGSLGYGSVHLSLDATITVDGDRATQECSIIMAKRAADRTTSGFVTTGRYTDSLVRTSDGWRFAHRYSVPDLGQEGMAAAYPSFDPEA